MDECPTDNFRAGTLRKIRWITRKLRVAAAILLSERRKSEGLAKSTVESVVWTGNPAYSVSERRRFLRGLRKSLLGKIGWILRIKKVSLKVASEPHDQTTTSKNCRRAIRALWRQQEKADKEILLATEQLKRLRKIESMSQEAFKEAIGQHRRVLAVVVSFLGLVLLSLFIAVLVIGSIHERPVWAG